MSYNDNRLSQFLDGGSTSQNTLYTIDNKGLVYVLGFLAKSDSWSSSFVYRATIISNNDGRYETNRIGNDGSSETTAQSTSRFDALGRQELEAGLGWAPYKWLLLTSKV